MVQNQLVTQNEIARWVAQQLEASAGQETTGPNVNQQNNVMMIITAIGKFAAFMFRKTNYETVIADVFGLGTFIRNCTIGHIGETEFYPCFLMQQETRFVKQYPTSLKITTVD